MLTLLKEDSTGCPTLAISTLPLLAVTCRPLPSPTTDTSLIILKIAEANVKL
jgi:hypothetical protein